MIARDEFFEQAGNEKFAPPSERDLREEGLSRGHAIGPAATGPGINDLVQAVSDEEILDEARALLIVLQELEQEIDIDLMGTRVVVADDDVQLVLKTKDPDYIPGTMSYQFYKSALVGMLDSGDMSLVETEILADSADELASDLAEASRKTQFMQGFEIENERLVREVKPHAQTPEG